ncbi:unnamed protein product [Danaus chrysippus]|uniref:(African queen) hypothetical protein n=1 Tax=Danaus chrysippus TaxID=151541 RepID=A0A8J2QPW2_9NEOP|nr:unnamed protein product [Danaus chrysippus]
MDYKVPESDIELFEDNPEEYVWRDIEGSDVATRRRAACDLLRALATHYDDKMMAIFGQYVEVSPAYPYRWVGLQSLVSLVENVACWARKAFPTYILK